MTLKISLNPETKHVNEYLMLTNNDTENITKPRDKTCEQLTYVNQ